MAEKTVVVSQQNSKPITILKWKVREGYSVSIGTIVLLYNLDGVEMKEQRKLKSTQAGKVYKVMAQEGAIINPGEPLFELEACIHPTVMKDMCAECGADLRKDELNSTASVPMVHSVPELKVSEEMAQKIGKADSERLLRDRKLVLLVDLDQTLIHTTNDIIPPNLKDIHHFQLYGPSSPWYHTRLRPGTHQFLTTISFFFELHICTFGARNYAHRITTILDPDGRFFSNRVLSRDECFNPTSKTANLKALFPCGDHMVCIIDDREDVWSHALNLIHVKPYHFFKHTGDINAPPGLEKLENDDKECADLFKISTTDENIIKAANLQNAESENSKITSVIQINEETCNDEKANNTRSKKADSSSKCDQSTEVNEIINVNGENESSDESKQRVHENKQENIPKQESKVLEMKTRLNEKEKELVPNICLQDQITDEKTKVFPTITQPNTEENSYQHHEPNEMTEVAKRDLVDTVHNNYISDNPQLNTNPLELNNTSIKIMENTNSSLNATLNLIEIDDPDDYLLYLEDILKRIHLAFYEYYDKMESGEVPDLKKVIPAVKGQVLKGAKLVFSGLVPTHIKLDQSKAYQVARSLGATVTQDIEDGTTHLVAVRPGTAKVNAGRRKKNLKVVTSDWLWACAERWEYVDEKLFPLSSKGSKNRRPPPHCSSPEHAPNYAFHEAPAARKRTPSGRFMDTINPLMSFSSDDIADMDKEVEDILDGESESEEESTSKKVVPTVGTAKEKEESASSSSSSSESLTAKHSKGFKRKWCPENLIKSDTEVDENTRDTDDELPSTKFRRGETLGSDLDLGDESNSDASVDVPDEMDDGEWNMMGAALEREFLSDS